MSTIQDDLIGGVQEALPEEDSPNTGSPEPRRHKAGFDRQQSDLIGYKLDDFVDDDNPVHALDDYVDSLNFTQLGFTNTQASSRHGQPAYSPATLLKLYLYGYQNGIRSTRHLARECKRNVEIMWLLQKLSPEYRTIGEFRAKNATAIRQVHKEFIQLCRQIGLLSESRVSIDGSHFKGNVSSKSFRTKEGLDRRNTEIEKEIDNWLKQVEQVDTEETQAEQAAKKKAR